MTKFDQLSGLIDYFDENVKKKLTLSHYSLEYAPPELRRVRVVSSVGRAAPLQGVGHRFDSCTTHHNSGSLPLDR